MTKKLLLISAIALGLSGAAQATSVWDPTGDFLASYTGPHQADLDVTSFSVTYNEPLQQFLVRSTMAGAIDPALAGFYVIGVNTGSATAPGPFAGIGQPNVIFNKVVVVQKGGTAAISGVAVPGAVSIAENAFSLVVPLSMLPSTGFAPNHYGWNIWPRSGTTGGAAVISDFAPENTTIAAAPEPSSWAMMLGGFGFIGGVMRSRRRIAIRFA
jgi:hypothetical protein